MSRQDIINVILMTAVFVLVFSAWCICIVLWAIQYARQRKKLKQRLGYGDKNSDQSQVIQLWRYEYESRRSPTGRKRETLAKRLARLRMDAGWRRPASTVLLTVIGMSFLACVAACMSGCSLWVGVGCSGMVLVAFWLITKKRIASRVSLFERQFVDSLGISARALRAGHPLVGAFQLVSEEIGNPVGQLFGEICQEQTLGLDLGTSIRRVADASNNADLKLFATAVGIQLRSGGNLAELMDSLSTVTRSRIHLHRRVRVLTAQTNMSKWILIGLPIVLFIGLNIIAPEYVRLFYTTWPGRCMLMGATASVLLGAWLMEKLSVVRY